MNVNDIPNSELKGLVTERDVQFYRENGYWVSPSLFSEEELDEFREHYYQVLNGKYETGIAPYKHSQKSDEISTSVLMVTNSMWSDATLSRLVLNSLIGKIATKLLRVKAVRYWRDHLWYKPPQSGEPGIVGWHQDYYYWQCAEPSELITAWIALDDVNQENGCIEVISGSHQWGLLEEGDLYNKDLKQLQKNIETVTKQPFKTVPLILPAGSVSFHHCLIIHGSRPNRSTKPRISLSIHLFPEGTQYRSGRSFKPFSNELLLSGKDGDYFSGPHFPVVYREASKSNPWDIELS